MTTLEMLERLGLAIALGVLIGAERQCRAQMAGLKTNVLVTVGSTLFVLLSAYGFPSTPGVIADPTRVAAQIVSGIGFLGAGVIMRNGMNVRGLTTAATLWCAAAVGSLCGTGMYALATAGAGVIVASNLLLRPLSNLLTRVSSKPNSVEQAVPDQIRTISPAA